MTFVQIIEYRTPDIQTMMKVLQEWREASRGVSTARRELVLQDRDDPGHYYTVVFFDSRESALRNSELPQTRAASAQLAELADGPPLFTNLEVLLDQSSD